MQIDTTLGTFFVELYVRHAPTASRNFLELSKSGYYDGTLVQQQVVRHHLHPCLSFTESSVDSLFKAEIQQERGVAEKISMGGPSKTKSLVISNTLVQAPSVWPIPDPIPMAVKLVMSVMCMTAWMCAVLFDIGAMSIAGWKAYDIWESVIRDESCEAIGECTDRYTGQTPYRCQNSEGTACVNATQGTMIRYVWVWLGQEVLKIGGKHFGSVFVCNSLEPYPPDFGFGNSEEVHI